MKTKNPTKTLSETEREQQLRKFSPEQHHCPAYYMQTVTGIILVHLNTIVYAFYESEHKRWMCMLANGKLIMLKPNSNADTILNCSPVFFQTNKHQIVNLIYLLGVTNSICCLLHPFDEDNRVTFSRKRYTLILQKLAQL